MGKQGQVQVGLLSGEAEMEQLFGDGIHGFFLSSGNGFRNTMDEKGRFVKFSPARHFLGGHQGYNQLHMTPLYDILNKVYLEAVIQPEPQKTKSAH